MEYKKFGDLSREEKLKLMAAWVDGEYFQTIRDGEWDDIDRPAWYSDSIYRISPKPIIKPSINWDHVSEKFVALAVDKCGDAYLFRELPDRSYDAWFDNTDHFSWAESHESFKPGSFTQNKDGIVENWEGSLVFRPGYELVDGELVRVDGKK